MKFVIEMSKEAYKKLVDYALKTCDSFSLCQYDVYTGAKDFEIENFNIITSNPKYSKDLILKNYSEKLLDEIYCTYINDNRMQYNENLLNHLMDSLKQKKISQEQYNNACYLYNKQSLTFAIELFVLDNKIEKIFKKYRNFLLGNEMVENGICYKFELNSDTIHVLTDGINNIYDFVFPKNLEDLCIYSNGNLWLGSIAHEEDCCIYCRSNDEYELLKSFGIIFRENN